MLVNYWLWQLQWLPCTELASELIWSFLGMDCSPLTFFWMFGVIIFTYSLVSCIYLSPVNLQWFSVLTRDSAWSYPYSLCTLAGRNSNTSHPPIVHMLVWLSPCIPSFFLPSINHFHSESVCWSCSRVQGNGKYDTRYDRKKYSLLPLETAHACHKILHSSNSFCGHVHS